MNRTLNAKELRELAQAKHTAFHDMYLARLPQNMQSGLHSLVDTLVMNLERAIDRIAELEAQLKQTEHIFSLLSKKKEAQWWQFLDWSTMEKTYAKLSKKVQKQILEEGYWSRGKGIFVKDEEKKQG